MLLQKIINRELYQFIEEDVKSWQEAIKLSCKPLVKQNIVDENYAELLIRAVEEYGPYIVLLPNLAMPHTSQHAEGVKDTAIAFTRLNKPVSFDDSDPDKSAQVFFTLASIDEKEHMNNMADLFDLLSEGDTLEKIMKATCLEDLKKILNSLNEY